MPEYITLMGADQVGRAGQAMIQAGDRMSQAAGNIADALARHRQDLYDHQNFLNDWLQRFAEVTGKEKTDG